MRPYAVEPVYDQGQDGSRLYSPRYGRFLQFPLQQLHAD